MSLGTEVLRALSVHQGKFVVIPVLVKMLEGLVTFGREPELSVQQAINKLTYAGLIDRFDLRDLKDGHINGGKSHLTGHYKRTGQTKQEQDDLIKQSLLVFSNPEQLIRGVSAYRINERGLARLALIGMQPTAPAIIPLKVTTVESLADKLKQLNTQLGELEKEIEALKASIAEQKKLSDQGGLTEIG